VDGGHGFGEQGPAPTLMPPWPEHPAGGVSMHVPNAPPTEPVTQHWMGGSVVVVVDTTVVLVVTTPVVVVVVGTVVVVVLPGQLPDPQASQQLGIDPTQALPPVGAWQRASLDLTLQRVFPNASVRQHVTAPARPHVERVAQSTTRLRHAARSLACLSARVAWCATHATY
jgi:hypothetical protein